MTYGQYAFAGFFSAIPMTAITAPFERIKIVLQIQGQQGGEQKYKGGFDALKGIYNEGGLRSGTHHSFLQPFADDSLSWVISYPCTRWSWVSRLLCCLRVCE